MVALTDLLRGFMQIACACVIAKTSPQVQHFIERRCCQCVDIGEGLHKARKIIQYRADLSLLQHDFRHPNAVRADILLPR